MAIKVSGTTVIDDSANVTSDLGGFKTINSTSIIGSGDITVGSTTAGDVGTYTMAYGASGSGYSAGDTIAGSSLRRLVYGSADDRGGYNLYAHQASGVGTTLAMEFVNAPYSAVSLGLSGTWRCVTNGGPGLSGRYQGHLWVRVS